MPGLMDVVPARTVVYVNGAPVELRGISISNIVTLFGRFPELQQAILMQQSPTVEEIVAMAPRALSSMIAAGAGGLGDPAQEKRADELDASTQLAMLTAIIKLTMPDGIGPFVERLTALAGTFNPVTKSTHQAMSSQLQ
jgi:hypothetical protein